MPIILDDLLTEFFLMYLEFFLSVSCLAFLGNVVYIDVGFEYVADVCVKKFDME